MRGEVRTSDVVFGSIIGLLVVWFIGLLAWNMGRGYEVQHPTRPQGQIGHADDVTCITTNGPYLENRPWMDGHHRVTIVSYTCAYAEVVK
jgi:hypothetical protein